MVVLCSPAEARPNVMAAIAEGIELAGVSIVVVGLDAAVSDDAVHEREYLAALARVRGPVIIGGFSLGGRIAARLCPMLHKLKPAGLLCVGYPFHVAGQPGARHGLEALARVRVPTLILQGTRDPHGSEAQVRGYALPDSAQVVWLRDGNHRLVPRERSGHTHERHVAAATAAAIAFCQGRRPAQIVA